MRLEAEVRAAEAGESVRRDPNFSRAVHYVRQLLYTLGEDADTLEAVLDQLRREVGS